MLLHKNFKERRFESYPDKNVDCKKEKKEAKKRKKVIVIIVSTFFRT
jgi:hypothetical protein